LFSSKLVTFCLLTPNVSRNTQGVLQGSRAQGVNIVHKVYIPFLLLQLAHWLQMLKVAKSKYISRLGFRVKFPLLFFFPLLCSTKGSFTQHQVVSIPILKVVGLALLWKNKIYLFSCLLWHEHKAQATRDKNMVLDVKDYGSLIIKLSKIILCS